MGSVKHEMSLGSLNVWFFCPSLWEAANGENAYDYWDLKSKGEVLNCLCNGGRVSRDRYGDTIILLPH